MRVPWWLRVPSPAKLRAIKQRKDRSFVSFLEKVEPLDKLPPHYQRRYLEARNRPPVPVHYKPVEVPYEYDPEHGQMWVIFVGFFFSDAYSKCVAAGECDFSFVVVFMQRSFGGHRTH